MSDTERRAIASGDGGTDTTNEASLAERLRRFRNQGIEREVRQRQATWCQAMVSFGFKYRLPDLQSMLGLSQLTRLDASRQRREEFAAQYHQAFAGWLEVIAAPGVRGARHARHINPVRLNPDRVREDRETIFQTLRAENIG
jgi:dTDP-4-amino-4,6-dideoxygalactose transaminase